MLGVVKANDATGGNGNVVLNATGSLAVAPGLPANTVNVTGNNLTFTSTIGGVGTAAAPLVIHATGIVNSPHFSTST